MQKITELINESNPTFFDDIRTQIKNHDSTCAAMSDVFIINTLAVTFSSCMEFFYMDDLDIKLQLLKVHSSPFIYNVLETGCTDTLSSLYEDYGTTIYFYN